ncbi:MAG: hypothetical protein H0X25_22730 [Acidobacteriales bacterium]|nr:hypothetical protein [Terriglobales bacterium]
MAYQFAHYETYAMHSRTNRSTARGVIAEAERVPTHSKHVTQPKAPKLLHGCMPSELLREIECDVAIAKDRTGKKKLPKDAQILLAGVVSMPLESQELLDAHAAYVRSGKKERSEALRQYQKWQKLTLAWLKQTYGDALRSVVLHYDEKQVHLHYYCANRLTGGTLNLDGLDVAGDAERSLGLGRKARNAGGAARKKVRAEALTAFQESFNQAVGLAMGWARLGPRKRRMSRADWKQEQLVAEKLASAMEQATQARDQLEASREINNDLRQWSGSKLAELQAALDRFLATGERAAPEEAQAVSAQISTLRRKLGI